MPTLSSQSTGAGCAGEPSPYDNAIDYVLAAVAHGLPLEACQPVSCWTILWAARGGVGFLLGSLRCHPARAERLRCYCWPLSPPLKEKKGHLYRPLGRNASHEFRLLVGKPTLKIDYQPYRGFWNFYAPLSILASPCQRYLVAPPYQYGRASGPWRFVNGLADDRGCKRDSCSHADTNCLTCTLYTYRPDPDTA